VIDYPLDKSNRVRLARAFKQVRRVDLSIDCVLEGQMGKAAVDRLEQPTVFMIQTGPFCYFAGDSHSPAAVEILQAFPHHTFLMPSTPGWIEAARALYGERLEVFPRTSFSANALSLDHLSFLITRSRYAETVEPIDLSLAECLRQNPDSWIDISLFDSAQDFMERGVGFCIRRDEHLIGAAYSSLVCSRGIEVSIYVEPAHRRKGMATALACRLLGRCLEQGMEPHWDAANIESCDLAEKLGYTRSGTYAAYFIREVYEN
jgi:GNAT superfamily N-acetyltransferase